MKYRRQQLMFVLATVLLLQGCTIETTSVTLSPEDFQKRKGYEELKKPAAEGKIKLIFRGEGDEGPTGLSFSFALSTSPEWCKGLEKIGSTLDTNRNATSSWMTNLDESRPPGFLAREIDAPKSESVQVQGIAHTFNNFGACATPHLNTLIVEPGHTYLITFVWSANKSCGLRLQDATNNADAPAPAYYRHDAPRANTWSGFAKCPWGSNP